MEGSVVGREVGVCREVRILACDKVQLPPEGYFSSDDLIWYPCNKKGIHGGLRQEAWIPADRFKDFLRGESCRASFQTVFKIRKTKRVVKQGPENQSTMIIRNYWCAYGPQDAPRPTLENWAEVQDAAKKKGKKGKGYGSRPAAMTIDVGLSFRRGCRCHFNTIVDSAREGAMLLSWVERNHVNLSNQICHGLLCPDAGLSNAQIAPRLSPECIQFVERLLRSRVPPGEIILEHQQKVAELIRSSGSGASIHWSRDMHLTSTDIKNIQARLRREGYLYHHEDGQAVRQWTERFPESVIHYVEQDREADKPFCLVISTPWMLEKMAVYGHEGAVCLDATHGTNRYGFQLFTWVVYDRHQNGLPVVWAILERYTTEDLQIVQEKIKKKIETCHSQYLGDAGKFIPSCFLTDDCAAEKASIRLVYPDCPIDLCIWHVRCAFNKNLMTKVSNPVHRALMNRDLASVMYTVDPDPASVSKKFVEKWSSTEPMFCQYYDKNWSPKLQEWVIAFRNHKRNNQNTTGAVERWHSTLKAHIRSSRMTKAMRKLSWLVVLLTSTIELYFWCYAELKVQGRIRNKVVEDQVVTVCVKARSILDSSVTTVEVDGLQMRLFQSLSNPDTCYTVMDWKTKESRCTCTVSAMGNLCKHEVKSLLMDGVTETEIVKTLGRRAGTNYGGADTLSLNREVPLDLNTEPADVILSEEPEFCFPFNMSDGPTSEATDPVEDRTITSEDVIAEIRKFNTKVEGDEFCMSHLLVLCKGAISEVLKMKAQRETNTLLHDSPATKVPNPLEVPSNAATAAELTRTKGWYEIMHESHGKKGSKKRLPEPDTGPVIPLERVQKQKWPSLNEQFDGAAIQHLLGQNKENLNPKRRKRTTIARPKIGSQSQKKPQRLTSGQSRRQPLKDTGSNGENSSAKESDYLVPTADASRANAQGYSTVGNL
ncbi:hypothetical protein R1sor_008933 [Riccia sorocarpa]|uniref:SWIM-type domain-containing protein n=1 Tax=Riccia sorocarpa TaxID=122646 RepID=A0ABD3HAD5_9MARC